MGTESLLDKVIFWFKNNKFFSIIILLAILIIAAANVFNSIDNILEKGGKLFHPASRSSLVTPGAKEKPEFGEVILKFGSEGIGPGMFHHAQSVATDGKDQLYVGENTPGGRIQVFDFTGKFITQWNTNKESKMGGRAIAADRHGTVYATDEADIDRYEGETGKSLGKVRWEEDPDFNEVKDVKTKLDGSLVVATSENLILFDSKEQVIQTIQHAIRAHSEQETSCGHIAVDGLGNIYAIQDYGFTIFKFSSDGTFLNRFGSQGENPGQFFGSIAIAVDGKGRVYVSDFYKGILVFESDGRYIATFNVDNHNGKAIGLIFNDRNELFVISEKTTIGSSFYQVIKYRISD